MGSEEEEDFRVEDAKEQYVFRSSKDTPRSLEEIALPPRFRD